MDYTACFDNANGVCVIRVIGNYRRPTDTETLQRFVVDYASTHGCRRYLIDLTQAEVCGDTMSIFDAANPQGELAASLRMVKTAVVRRELTSDDHFFETVAANRAFQWHAFDSFEKGVEWLRGAKSST